MDGVNILRQLTEENNTEIRAYAESIVTGKPPNMEEYRRMCGVIHGLNIANEKIHHVLHMLERGEDTDD
jgi:hypothetical protein